MSPKSTPNSTWNPLADNLDVSISVPHTMKIKLVDASLLWEFELWMYLSSLLFSFCSGFWFAYIQSTEDTLKPTLLFTSWVFTFLFAFTLIVAIIKRTRINTATKEIALSASKIK